MIDYSVLRDVRKHLHKHPELSSAEHQTQHYLIDFLQQNTPTGQIIELSETGFVVVFNGAVNSARVMLRCELDALPIVEQNNFAHRSIYDGVSHKCGHDGHMTILVGVALYLEQHPPSGDVILLFQPAEEIGTGAEQIAASKLFNNLGTIDYVFALHNLPGAEVHSIHIREGEITPSVISTSIHLVGKTAHAAEPQNGLNPALFISELQVWVSTINQTDPTETNFQIITPIFIDMGSRDFGISAGHAEIGFTLRTSNNEAMDQLKTAFNEKVEELSVKHNISIKMNWSHAFRSVKNETTAIQFIEDAAKILDLELVKLESPFPWGEDFGVFTERIPGALFGIGAGMNSPALHNPDYDFPDEIIPSGINMFLEIIKGAQK